MPDPAARPALHTACTRMAPRLHLGGLVLAGVIGLNLSGVTP
jgi:hypothetical protein